MQGSGAGSIVERMIGAARLDGPTYEAVEHDEDATLQAFIVVILVAIAGGLGLLFIEGIGGFFAGLVQAIMNWIVFAIVAYFVGARLIPDKDTAASPEQLLRTLGFAQTPGLLSIFVFIPILGFFVSVIVFVWLIITSIVAIRHALEMSTGRAIVVALISVVVIFIITAIFAAIGFGAGLVA